jgi:hypothetical protein
MVYIVLKTYSDNSGTIVLAAYSNEKTAKYVCDFARDAGCCDKFTVVAMPINNMA